MFNFKDRRWALNSDSKFLLVLLSIIAAGAVTAALFLFFAWRNLETKLQTPEFKEKLEARLARITKADVKIGTLDARLNLHPYLSATNISVVLPNDDVRLRASEAQLTVQLWPLLKKKIVFSLSVNKGRVIIADPLLSSQPVMEIKIRKGFSQFTVKKTQTPAPSWNVDANWDLHDIDFPRARVPRFQGQADIGPSTGEIRHTSAEILGGIVTGSGSWNFDRARQRPLTVSLQAKGDHLRVDDILALTVSTVAWTHAFNCDLTLVEFPISPTAADAVGILNSLLKSRSVALTITDKAGINSRSPLKNMAGSVTLDSTNRTFIADLGVNWNGGGFRARATLPHAFQSNVNGPLDVAATIENMDITLLPTLAGRLDFSNANVGADIKWRAVKLDRTMFERATPQVTWSIDGHFKKLVWRGVAFDDFSGRASWKSPKIRFENVQGRLSGGTLTASGELSDPQEKLFHKFAAHAEISNVDIAPFMFAFSSNPVLRGGRFSSNVDVTGPLHPWDPQHITGTLRVDGRKGRIRQGSFVAALFTKLNIHSLIETVSGNAQKGLPFDVISGTSTVANGRFTFDHPFLVKGPDLEVAYTGWLGVQFKTCEGTLIVNPLVGTRNLITVIPGVSNLMLGPQGEFLPLIVDVKFEKNRLDTNFRSIESLTDLPKRIIHNVIHLPASILGIGKK